MTMAWIWTGMAVLSILCGLATGRGELVAAAAVEGAQAAVELCVSIAGMLCLWTGVMEVMRRSGLAEGLSRLLRPVLSLLFPQVSGDRGVMDSISANVSANLLGLGNAATPLGLEAVCSIDLKGDEPGLLALCGELDLPLTTYTAQELEAVPGEFSASPFVAEITGVDNVCERAAVLASGGCIRIPKQAGGGVTFALALCPYAPDWRWQNG